MADLTGIEKRLDIIIGLLNVKILMWTREGATEDLYQTLRRLTQELATSDITGAAEDRRSSQGA